jgi:hypothetical protein
MVMSALAFLLIPLLSSAQGLPDGVTLLSLAYSDSNGPGVVTIANQGADAATGGSSIAVQLAQNGATFQGQGVLWQAAPSVYALSFWLTNGPGNTYAFAGTLSIADDSATGKGRYQSIQNPSFVDMWTMQPLQGAPSTAPASPRTVTLTDSGQTLQLQVGDRFLLDLDAGLNWDVTVDDPTVVSLAVDAGVPGGAQGFYEARQTGQTMLTAVGDPQCRQAQPPCGAPSRLFRLTIAVQ